MAEFKRRLKETWCTITHIAWVIGLLDYVIGVTVTNCTNQATCFESVTMYIFFTCIAIYVIWVTYWLIRCIYTFINWLFIEPFRQGKRR
jgi:hypothetical protein